MAAPLRFIPEQAKKWLDRKGRPIAIVEVTTRTIQGRFLLKPTATNRSLILGVIGRAQRLYDFELYGYACLSNHYSMLIGVDNPQQMGVIVGYINGNIAREIGRKENSDWRDRFWARRGRPIVILTNRDLELRLRYLLANSTKEHLVKRPQFWPGAHCAKALISGTHDIGAWVDRTALRELRRRAGSAIGESKSTERITVKLSTLPCWEGLAPEEIRQKVREICAEISLNAAEERKGTRSKPMGRKRVLRYHPHHRPEEMEPSLAPPVHCSNPGVRRLFFATYRSFVAAYHDAHHALVNGIGQFAFPEGCHPPTSLQRAAPA